MSAAADARWKNSAETNALVAFEAADTARAVGEALARRDIKARTVIHFDLADEWPVRVYLHQPADRAEVERALALMGLNTRHPETLDDDHDTWTAFPSRLTVTYPRGDKAWRWVA